MKIGFDARMISHPGIGRYMHNLLNAMLKLNTGHEFILFGDKAKLKNYTYHLTPCEIVHWNAPIYSLREQITQPFSRYKLDILHCPHFNTPYFYNGRLIVTIHDLIYLIFQQSCPSKLAKLYANIMASRSAAKSDHIIAVSENTKKDILRFFKKAEPSKIKVIYEAADPHFKIIDDQEKLTDIKKRYNLPDKFILFVGSLKYHKNLITAMEAFSKLKEKVSDCSFVVVGRSSRRESRLKKMVTSQEIIYLGEVPSEDLVTIYNLSTVLLHPSLYEGFGLTILEAMACGIPVVSSNAASLPEVGGDAVLYVNTNDAAGFSDALYKVLTNETLRKNLINKGLNRVKEFSWEKTARETLEMYKATA